MKVIFDSCALITSGKFSIENQPIVDSLAQTSLIIHIPQAIKIEVVDDGLQAGHQDALTIKRQIDHGAIRVEPILAPASEVTAILDDYGVRKGDRDFIYLAHQIPYDYIVTDDFLLLLICYRFGLPVKMFPDLIELLVKQSMWTIDQGRKALQAIGVRYKRGFIEHSLRRINKP